jgi:hypothetical protein
MVEKTIKEVKRKKKKKIFNKKRYNYLGSGIFFFWRNVAKMKIIK